MTAPLHGLLVADFSRVLAGPLATMTLADLGATVVKVERPGAGDESRAWGPPWTEYGSSYYESLNRSKYSVTLDLTDPDDRTRALELARRADVVVENFKPGSLDRLGLDYASVAALNPRAVYCTITGFGEAGGRDRPGYDFLVQAVGGLMSVTGDADGEPTKVGAPLVDVLTGKDAVIGILAALAARERTGEGQHVRVELLSSLLGGLINQTAGYLTTGVAPIRMGNRHPSVVPYQTLHCADVPIAVACGNDGQFARLVEVIGRPELAADPRFATNGDRVANRDALVEALEGGLAARPAAEWEERLVAVGVPAGLVGDVGDALARAESFGLAPTITPDGGRTRLVRHPVRYSATPPAPAAPPPGLGEHAVAIAAWLDDPAAGSLPHPGEFSAPRADGTAR
ncbi:MAG TPA: CoA transferase [Jatrophihabitans sp.]|jgi:formyl-CoA transferase|uniref:CaiB/BaiF CoA transferase family protein n=1 Tax=Jatrophihabitans sp. TaxID=1932789 RepID=UPI002DFD3330|nr:CoA transferase [Jatrophihabitans sp.]